MSDDPSKIAEDRRTVSSQEHEVRSLREAVAREFPHVDPELISAAIQSARREAAPSESRGTIIESIRRKLKHD